MIDAAKHDNANAIFALKLVEGLARLPANVGFAFVQGLEARGEASLISSRALLQHRAPRLEHLVSASLSRPEGSG